MRWGPRRAPYYDSQIGVCKNPPLTYFPSLSSAVSANGQWNQRGSAWRVAARQVVARKRIFLDVNLCTTPTGRNCSSMASRYTTARYASKNRIASYINLVARTAPFQPSNFSDEIKGAANEDGWSKSDEVKKRFCNKFSVGVLRAFSFCRLL